MTDLDAKNIILPKLKWWRAKTAWRSTAFEIWIHNQGIPADELIAELRARAEEGTFGFYKREFICSEPVTIEPAHWQRLEAECRRAHHQAELDLELDGRLLDGDYEEVT